MSSLPASSTRSDNPLLVLILAGCILAVVTNGVRSSLGLFTLPLTSDLGISRESWGLALAVQNLVWGLVQPFSGALADKLGTARVLALGLVIYALGTIIMAFSTESTLIFLSAGIVVGAGIATSSFSIVMAAFGRRVPQEKRSLVFGVATAASSFGQFLFAPIGQQFISSFGWQMALLYLTVFLVVALPFTMALRGKSTALVKETALPLGVALRRAFSHGSYRLLIAGFFVCGFHVAFITVHMPAYLVQCGLSAETASWTIAVIGLFNIVGSLLAGQLGTMLPKPLLLASIYFLRAVAFALFVFIPVSEFTAFLFAGVMGLLWLSTVPLTAGLVTQFFGARYMGMLYGIAFLSHQVGSFLGIWFGGLAYDLTGNYSLVWYLGIVLGLGSAVLHLPIREAGARSFGLKPA
jgi:predicted MFS family arabinose efflux permease